MLPRAPSADTVAGWFSGKAAGFRSTAGSLAGHVLCLSLWSEQRLFPSLGLGWGGCGTGDACSWLHVLLGAPREGLWASWLF